MVQRSSGNPPPVGAAGVTPPNGEDNNTDSAGQLGRAIVRAANAMEQGPSSVAGDMLRTGLLTAAAGAGIAAVGAALDSRVVAAGGLMTSAVGLAMAGYSSSGLDRAITDNTAAIGTVARLTAEGLGARAGEGASSDTSEATSKPEDPPSGS